MNFLLQPWQLLLLIVASLINEEQQRVIEYLRTKNRILKEKLERNASCSTTTSVDRWLSKATRNAIRHFLDDYHRERNHQGLENKLIESLTRPAVISMKIEATERLGGLIRSYRRAA